MESTKKAASAIQTVSLHDLVVPPVASWLYEPTTPLTKPLRLPFGRRCLRRPMSGRMLINVPVEKYDPIQTSTELKLSKTLFWKHRFGIMPMGVCRYRTNKKTLLTTMGIRASVCIPIDSFIVAIDLRDWNAGTGRFNNYGLRREDKSNVEA